MIKARAYQGETLDQLCHRVVGRTAGITEAVLRSNPGLAELGDVLPQGTEVVIPVAATAPQTRDTVQLWS